MSTFAAVASSLFCFEGKEMTASSSRLSPSSAIYRCDDTTGDIRGRYTHSGFNMIHAGYEPEIIAMHGGKLLVISGVNSFQEDGPWAEVFYPYLNFTCPESCLPNEIRRWSLLTSSKCSPSFLQSDFGGFHQIACCLCL